LCGDAPLAFPYLCSLERGSLAEDSAERPRGPKGAEAGSLAEESISRAVPAGWPTISITAPLTGVTRVERTAFWLMLVGKLAASVIVIIAGSGAVVRSGNDFDLIVNTLAAVFIVDIPALAYKVFLPPAYKRLVKDIPPFAHPSPLEERKCTCRSIVNRCSAAIAAKLRLAFVGLYIYIYFGACVGISILLVQVRWCGGFGDTCPAWLWWFCGEAPWLDPGPNSTLYQLLPQIAEG